MIKKYNQYIKENHKDIDPFDEEDWNEVELTPLLQIAMEQNKPFNEITELDCSDRGLDNLDGIEQLINLEELYCSYNRLTELNLDKNTNLKILYCTDNKLITLNLNKNINLKELYCINNKLTELNLDRNTNLRYLSCSFNQLTELNLDKNINLKELYYYGNQFSNKCKKYLLSKIKQYNMD